MSTSDAVLRDMTLHLPYASCCWGCTAGGALRGVHFDSAANGICEGAWTPKNEACDPNGEVRGGLFNDIDDRHFGARTAIHLPFAHPNADLGVPATDKRDQ